MYTQDGRSFAVTLLWMSGARSTSSDTIARLVNPIFIGRTSPHGRGQRNKDGQVVIAAPFWRANGGCLPTRDAALMLACERCVHVCVFESLSPLGHDSGPTDGLRRVITF